MGERTEIKNAKGDATADRSTAADSPKNEPGRVLMTHGYGGHTLLLVPLARRLAESGYACQRWGYRSLWRGTEHHARRLIDRLKTLDSEGAFHIVTHSMGALVLRTALLAVRPSQLQKVVMLCPPNHGAHAASRVKRFAGWASPALAEISDLPDSLANRLPTNITDDYCVGTIVADGDWVVSPESTQLPGLADSVTLPGMHSGLLFKPECADQVAHFLQFGRFNHEVNCSAPS
ncbi:MAG TPA: hypothetical protein DDW52_20050 [Planctomycetaceae bacterium]|nr:hypothetical protein [Planctomycetaceae bacterium]